MTNPTIEAEIKMLETYSKQGESYTNSEGRYGWRNPIRSDTGDLMRCLTIAVSPTRTLEFGTGHGLSTLYMAAGLKDHTTDSMDTIELSEEVAASSQERFNACGICVKVHQGEAMDIVPTLKGHYDMVFFDAQKSHYHQQLMALLDQKLIGAGTVILADNVVDRQSECQSFLDWFVHNTINHYILQTECGLLVAYL
jgi:predicted O-methyltransferase YrrM